ncbi:Ribonuclease P protein component [Candidatus Clavichlamydia salmonicola]|uniref:ribonuclease P protein component n=1 Tax=Candidatus Clavichlamydia salmonicola TaxID=469812 RepID=UPI001891578B|nr:ribonuclease P protein component [Candidatus Clavichlamydia salmonicola]MBF5050476.1 Ribonuclease P protein component [Candidatus Clavichlamydia salmonicola]
MTSCSKSFSFPKSARLLSSHRFRQVSKYGIRRTGSVLHMSILTGKIRQNKLGITVSKKFGKATKRNYFKRVVREAFRSMYKDIFPFCFINVAPRLPKGEKLSLEKAKADIQYAIKSTHRDTHQKKNSTLPEKSA